MTVLVGVKCSDGIVIGADSIATSAAGPQGIVQLPTDKLVIVGDRIILAGTGSVGLGQRFGAIVQNHWDGKAFQKPMLDCIKSMTTAGVQDFQSTGTPRHPQYGFGFGALLAAPMADQPELIEFGIQDFQPEIKREKLHFVTMGSGQALADPFIAFISRVLWDGKMPDVKAGMFGVYWALQHTIQYAPGGVGAPARLATLRREGGAWHARILEDAELQEQAQHIGEIEKRIGAYPVDILAQAQAEAPPQPPAE